MQGRHYQDRTSTADITSRVNQVVAIGGVPAGGSANVTATYNGSSQSTLGIRSLDPPIQLPGISDTATIQAIANGIGATLDQTWNRVSLTVLPTLAQRVHASQPGGAMVRYWEPTRYPYPESEVGAGYVGPFIGQSVDSDGLTQRITAGNIPITSSVDINNMVASWAARAAAITQQITGAALNLNQTLTGSLQSGTGTLAPGGARATLWSLGQQEFAAIDENGVARAEMGDLAANGISPAQWGFRANAAAGSPIFDSQGLIAVMSVLGSFTEAAVVNLTSLTPVVVNGTVTVTFSLARAANVLVTMQSTADVTTSGARAGASGQIYFDGTAHGPTARWDTANGFVLAAPAHFRNLAAGSHTVDFRVNVDNALCTWVNFQTTLDVFLLGS
jgi:hypothetical protein